MPLDKESKREYQREYMRKKRSNKIEDVRPDNVRPELKPYKLSDGQIHDPSKTPDAVIPDRVWLSRIPGHTCSISRREFIKSMQACNRAREYKAKKVDLNKIEELRAIL